MSPLEWPNDYVAADGNGANLEELLHDFKIKSGFSDLNTSESNIFLATFEAFVWSYPLNETHRYYNLDTVTKASSNSLFKPSFAASWLNKSSAPAPNASLLYINGWLDLSKGEQDNYGEQILQLPPNPENHYYVLAVLDSYINTVGSFGPRTTSQGASDTPQNILLVGPDSPYYGQDIKEVDINGATLKVLQVDTSKAWITARINTNTLDNEAMSATRVFINGTADEEGSGFQLTSLKNFKDTGTVPYTPPISQSANSSDPDVIEARSKWQVPSKAYDFFAQVSDALLINPVPAELDVNLTPPAYQIWIGNQNSLQNADTAYQPPSALGADELAALNKRFTPIGLDLNKGFVKPSNWTERESLVFQKSYEYTNELISEAITSLVKGKAGTNNGWNITNENIGVYPNNWSSWFLRAGAAIEGGAANIPNDAVYPTTEIDNTGNQLTSTYNYWIETPAKEGKPLNESETYAPAQGFWAFTVYQPNPGNAYQPFLIENALQNTAYSPINATATLTSEGRLRTAIPSNWNTGTAVGTALLTGSSFDVGGVDANTIYYVKTADEIDDDLLITLASDYETSYGSNGIPIGGEGSPGPEIALSGSAGNNMSFGWINPVAQLGSNQLNGENSSSTTLVPDINGSIKLTLSSMAPKTNLPNWLPTPLVKGSGSSDPKAASEFQMMARYYWPTADSPSILADSQDLYIPPVIERRGLNRIHIWDLLTADAEAMVENLDPDFASVDPLNTVSPFSNDVVGALIDLRILPDTLDGESTIVNYSYSRSAAYDNQLFFYAIDDITGVVDGLYPEDSNYLNEAWTQRLQPEVPIIADNNTTTEGVIQLTAGKLYAPIVNTNQGHMFTAFDSANPQGYRHFDLLSSSSFGFEDLLNGGNEHDRNDGIFQITSIDI
tara:strand:- start:743 stop:3439 length:2697 start_codon:yes stop_codon:yes gene_type:complete